MLGRVKLVVLRAAREDREGLEAWERLVECVEEAVPKGAVRVEKGSGGVVEYRMDFGEMFESKVTDVAL